jgi:hypothetical protein
MDRAMRPRAGVLPDRVPVMCQLALGHYFLQAGPDGLDIWHDTGAFGDVLIALQRRYGFDGILVNLPGRDPGWRTHVRSIERRGVEQIVRWVNGAVTVVPPDDNPRVFDESGRPIPRVSFESIVPERAGYVEPHELPGAPAREHAFPPHRHDTIRYVRERAPDVSVHGEVFSPFSQWLELLDHAEALMALVEDPGKVKACLQRFAEGAVTLARGQAEAGVDAVLISSAFAGAGFISPRQYQEFVLPFERQVIAGIRAAHAGLPIYTHTCGAIGDRLELMEETGTDGIDTLDPPPLGTVDLADARRRLGGRLFIKGNLDPVGILLQGTPRQCHEAALRALADAKAGGGFILSSACSVAPRTPPENVHQLRRAVEERGWYVA